MDSFRGQCHRRHLLSCEKGERTTRTRAAKTEERRPGHTGVTRVDRVASCRVPRVARSSSLQRFSPTIRTPRFASARRTHVRHIPPHELTDCHRYRGLPSERWIFRRTGRSRSGASRVHRMSRRDTGCGSFRFRCGEFFLLDENQGRNPRGRIKEYEKYIFDQISMIFIAVRFFYTFLGVSLWN